LCELLAREVVRGASSLHEGTRGQDDTLGQLCELAKVLTQG
jgi:hypothetical protein